MLDGLVLAVHALVASAKEVEGNVVILQVGQTTPTIADASAQTVLRELAASSPGPVLEQEEPFPTESGANGTCGSIDIAMAPTEELGLRCCIIAALGAPSVKVRARPSMDAPGVGVVDDQQVGWVLTLLHGIHWARGGLGPALRRTM